MSKMKQEQGNTYGRLTVESFAFTRVRINRGKRGSVAFWNCLCSCGARHVVSGMNLRSGQVRSCGTCGLHSESVQESNKRRVMGPVRYDARLGVETR